MPSYSTKNLQPGEVLIAEVRPYLFAQTGKWLLAALFLLAPFFFLLPLLQRGVWGAVLLAVVFLIGILLAIRAVLMYTRTVLIVTSHRLIDLDQKGLFERVVSETTYDHVQDVSFSVKGVRQTLFGYGNIAIQMAASQANLEVHDTRNPATVHELIQKARAEAQPMLAQEAEDEDGEEETSEDLVKTVRRLRKMMGKRDFQNLVKKIEDE